jgi:hypothetical protein
MRQDRGDDFDEHEPDDQEQCDRQVASIGIDADGMRMVVTTMVFVMVFMTVIVRVTVFDAFTGHRDLRVRRTKCL